MWQHRKTKAPSGGMYDSTEMFQGQALQSYSREAFIKLGYYLVFFFIALYMYVLTWGFDLTGLTG